MGWWNWIKTAVKPKPKTMPTSYKGVVIEGSTFPDSPYKTVSVKLNDTIKNEYLPALNKAMPTAPKGLKLLMIAMTHQEGFRKGTRSHRYNNPGNVGNTDSGANKGFQTLEAGIMAQAEHLKAIAEGKKKAYLVGKDLHIAPFYSKEIANNPQYGLPAHLPGYNFKPYSGQLDQFIKIYSTGARATNSYLNVIVSYFAANGLTITPSSRLQDIIEME